MPYASLGKFVKPYEIDDVRFYLRGLNLGEYVDLIEKSGDNISTEILIDVAECGIVTWENFWLNTDNGVEKIKYSKENVQRLGHEELIEIGKYVYEELTVLTDEEKNKFEAFVHFLYWSSDDENKSDVKTFQCQTCLDQGIAIRRPCGKYDMQYRKKRAGHTVSEDSEDESDEDDNSDVAKAMAKYRTKKTKTLKNQNKKQKKSKKRDEKKRRKQRRYVKLGDYKMKECPVSYIDDWIKTLGEAIYNCEKSDRNFFDGGVSNQRYKIYKASQVVRSTYNKIEKKDLEDDKEN